MAEDVAMILLALIARSCQHQVWCCSVKMAQTCSRRVLCRVCVVDIAQVRWAWYDVEIARFAGMCGVCC